MSINKKYDGPVLVAEGIYWVGYRDEKRNNVFISYYISSDNHHLLESIDTYHHSFKFNDRVFEFIPTPYSHSPGSFATYDQNTKTLFSSDIFGSYAAEWGLFLELNKGCFICDDYKT